MKVKLAKAVRTCNGMPSQWDAWDRRGRYYYLRYRYGHGTAERGGPYCEPIAEFWHDTPWGGFISLTEFAERSGLRLSRRLRRELSADDWEQEMTDSEPLAEGNEVTQEMW